MFDSRALLVPKMRSVSIFFQNSASKLTPQITYHRFDKTIRLCQKVLLFEKKDGPF